MWIHAAIGIPGAVLTHAARAALAARWGADEAPSVAFSERLNRRFRGEAGSPWIVCSPGRRFGQNRLDAMGASFTFDRLAVRPAGVPSPRSELSP